MTDAITAIATTLATAWWSILLALALYAVLTAGALAVRWAERREEQNAPPKPRLAHAMPPPRPVTEDEMRAATEEASELHQRLKRATEGMEEP